MKKIKTEIIPLGQNCIPRTVLTRWKIKPSKIFGEKTYPFDLAVFGLPEITKCLKNDFNEIFDNLLFNGEYWYKSPNCIYFMHDKKYKENEKEKLISKYKKRINNFRTKINETDNILFVQILGEDEDIINQYNELKRLRNDKPFKMAIIDTQNIVKSIDLKDIYVLKLPFPSEEYKNNWWKKEFYNSKIGKQFEKQIADFCLNVLNT